MKEIIDLTHELKNGIAKFDAPWHPIFSFTQLGKHETEGRATAQISLGTHTGTHVDAPLHFIKGGRSIEDIPLDTMMGKVTIVDFSKIGKNKPITKIMLIDIKITKRMLFKFGWGKYYNSKKFYQNYPFFTKDAADYLVSQNVKLLAMDTPSPDNSDIKLEGSLLGTKKDSPIHKIFLTNGITLVEYIANLDKVKEYLGWNICVMPLKIKGADGSPARVCIYR